MATIVAAAADSLAHAAAAALPAGSMLREPLSAEMRAAVEHWHDYYLLAGTAAVTLVGLLFVALSFHLDTLLQEEKAHLLGTARMAFLSFLYVMVLSLAFLAPELSTKMLSMFMLMFSLILLGNAIWVMRRGQQQPGGFERFLRRRYVMTGFVAGVAIVSAVQCLLHPKPSWLNNFGFIIAIMLVNAASISWDLLVQVGRLKLAHERKRPE